MSTLTTISRENYEYLQKHVYTESGIVLDGSKHYLLESRLTPIIRRKNLHTLDELCALMRAISGAALRQEVVEAMTTNETFFFRDIAPFEYLRKELIPELLKRKSAAEKIRIWSAACSTGQEPYSLAMLITESQLGRSKFEIVATDLASSILEQAKAGRFSQIEVNRGLPASLLVKYFTRVGLDWQIRPEIQQMIRFEVRDLRQQMTGLGQFDVIFCRNVLIYFDVETKKKILNRLCQILAPGGVLFLGGAESTLNLTNSFERFVSQQATFYRKAGETL